MGTPQTPHIYSPIAELDEEPSAGRPGRRVELENGTIFCFPGIGYTDFKKLQLGDMVLIDLHDWHARRMFANVFVHRRRGDGIPGADEVSRFVIGENCVIWLSSE